MNNIIQLNDLDFGDTGKRVQNIELDYSKLSMINHLSVKKANNPSYEIINNVYKIYRNTDTSNAAETAWDYPFTIYDQVIDFRSYLNQGYTKMYVMYQVLVSDENITMDELNFNIYNNNGAHSHTLSFVRDSSINTETNKIAITSPIVQINKYCKYRKAIAVDNEIAANKGYSCILNEAIYDLDYLLNGSSMGYWGFIIGWIKNKYAKLIINDNEVNLTYNTAIHHPIIKFIKES